MLKRALLLLLLFCGILLGGPTLALAAPPATQTLVLSYNFDAPTSARTAGLLHVELDGASPLQEVGEPALPLKTARVLLPAGMVVQDIKVSGVLRASLQLTAPIAPAREPRPLSAMPLEPASPLFGPVYNQTGPYPAALAGESSVQRWRGHDILYVSLHPLQYWPQEQRLDAYRSLTLTVTLRPASETLMTYSAPPEDRARLQTMVDNPEALSGIMTAVRDTGWATGLLDDLARCNEAIITSPELRDTPSPDNLQELAAYRTAQDIPACIITTDWIAAHYSGARPSGGSDLQTAIRAFIRDAYVTWNITYVLLVGDADAAIVGDETEAPIVPVRGLAVTTLHHTDNNIPADLYYACLDGSFDRDADGLYGEPTDGAYGGLVDLLGEVYVGRAAVDSPAELRNFVRKTIAYEQSDHDYLDRVLMVGEDLGWPSPWGGDRKDAVLLGSSANGYTTAGFANSPWTSLWRADTLYDRDAPDHYWSGNEMRAAINSPVHLLNHMGHGSWGQVMRIGHYDVENYIYNAASLVGYSQACYSGSFDNRALDTVLSYDCIVENLTVGAYGAVAFVANARYGWGDDLEPELGPSQYYDREFWDGLLGEGLTAIGAAHQDAKEDVFALRGPGGMNGYLRWAAYGLNLLGDPALQVHTPAGHAGARITALNDGLEPPGQGNGDGQAQDNEILALNCEVWNGTDTPLTMATVTASSTDACLIVLDGVQLVANTPSLGVTPCQKPILARVTTGCLDRHQAALTLTVEGLQQGQLQTFVTTHTVAIQGTAAFNVAPSEVVVALPRDSQTSVPLTLTNPGTAELTIDFYTASFGVSPLGALTWGANMLIITPRPDSSLDPLLHLLQEIYDFSYVVWDPARGAPTPQDMLVYDLVLVGNRFIWEDSGINPNTLGNALADYIDLGGKVIETLLASSNGVRGLTGRYITGGYGPVNVATGYVEGLLSVSIADSEHDLTRWIGPMTSTTARLNVTARPGADVPAVYTNTNIPYIAANENVVFINQQLVGGDLGGCNLKELIGSIVGWFDDEAEPWLETDPWFIHLAPGESVEMQLLLNSDRAHAPAIYKGEVYFDMDSSTVPDQQVPVELAVLDDLNAGRVGGVVRSARSGAPLAGALVQLQATGGDPRERVTDERGAYSFWPSPATYIVSAELAGYLPTQAVVTVSPQERVAHDMTLQRDAPWLTVDSTVLTGATPLGHSLEHTMVLRNEGIQPLEVAIEVDEAADWVTLTQDSLTIAPGAQAELGVTLNTAFFGQPQVARASLRLLSNDPDAPEVEVLLEIEATLPAGHGLVSGAVTCQRSGGPLAAQVSITQGETVAQAHEAAADGHFGPWAVPAGEWAVRVDYDGYVSVNQIVTVIAGEATAAPATLLLDAPWLRLTPAYLVARDAPSGATTLTANLANGGIQPLHYALVLDELPDWVHVSPGDGLVAVGAQENIVVQLDTALAPPGWTALDIPILSDDPWQSPAALRLYVQRGQVVTLPTLRR